MIFELCYIEAIIEFINSLKGIPMYVLLSSIPFLKQSLRFKNKAAIGIKSALPVAAFTFLEKLLSAFR